MIFGACGQSSIQVGPESIVSSNSQPFTISGSTQIGFYANNTGALLLSGSTVTMSGTPNFSIGTAVASLGGIINAPTMTFVGGATGTRFGATLNGVIYTNSGGANYFPGSIAGSTNTGGQYA